MAGALLAQQQADYVGTVTDTQQAPRIAVPDLLGGREISAESDAFNNALWNALVKAAGDRWLMPTLNGRAKVLTSQPNIVYRSINNYLQFI